MKIFLKIRYCKCCIIIELVKVKELILLKVKTVKNVRFVIIGFFYQGFKFQDSVCNSYHNLTILNVNVSNIAIFTIKNVDYCYISLNIIAIHLLENSVLENGVYV